MQNRHVFCLAVAILVLKPVLPVALGEADAPAITQEKQRYPDLTSPWANSLGMKFMPVPGTKVLFGIWDVRVKDYAPFVQATGEEWSKPDFAQGPDHPAVNVSWEGAQRFCAWLTQIEHDAGLIAPQQAYRLPKDWEWSVAVGLDEPKEGTPHDKNGKIKGCIRGTKAGAHGHPRPAQAIMLRRCIQMISTLLRRSAALPPTRLAYLIWAAMCGSGARINMTLTMTGGYYGAVPGSTTNPPTRSRRTDSTIRTGRALAAGSGWCWVGPRRSLAIHVDRFLLVPSGC